MATDDLASKLSELEAHIDKAEARLKLKGLLSADHMATARELKDRHKHLSEQVQGEIADVEAHGHHVGRLEASVREWLDSLEIEID